jgi:hypothetical protein
MSTKTNFKRIALVAVAALGLGVLSSVPSQAVVSSTITITGSSTGTATLGLADSTTAGTVTVKWQSIVASDSIVLTASLKSAPALGVAPNVVLSGKDTLTAQAATVIAPAALGTTFTGGVTPGAGATGGYTYNYQDSAVVNSAVGYNSATLRVQMDSATSTTRAAGTYVYTITAYPYVLVGTTTGTTPDYTRSVSADVTITVAATAGESTVASAATSSAFIGTTAGAKTTDAAIAVPAAVSSTDTARAFIYVLLKNASSVAAGESITVTTNIGNVGTAAARGKSVVLSSNGTTDISIYSDGTAGTATITVKSTSVTFASKTVVFYAAAPTSIVASALNTTPGVGTTPAALGVVAKDANGNIYGGSLYVSSSALTVISDTATACTYNSTNSRHECSLTGLVGGTAVITVRDAATAPTISSNAVSFTVSANAPASVKLSFDKATYAPGEKATLLISVLDSAGKSVAANTFANLFATGGIALSTAAGNGSETTTAISATTVSLASYALGTLTDPVKAFTIYMPSSGGTITAKATGGTSLPLAAQVAVTATATVTDSGAAALAAVTALATTVASLKTLITTLTNLVLKIQKKVKA